MPQPNTSMTTHFLKPTFVVSLDFELYWGTRDFESLRDYRNRITYAKQTITSLLNLFREYEIHATWATVGMLFLENRGELLEMLPSSQPNYTRPELSPYPQLDSIGDNERTEPSCYAASAINEIQTIPFQEVGTHTFSHYYCLEEGQTRADFKSDLDSALQAAARRRVTISSIVFPRNQVNQDYLDDCRSRGILCYRGAGSSWMYTARKQADETFLRRACRIVNSYWAISGFTSVPMHKIARQNLPFDFPGTSHFRPSLMITEPLRSFALRRIYRGLDYAVTNSHLYHFWLHPEDFFTDLQKKIEVLRKVLDYVSKLRAANKLESLNMSELAHRLLREKEISQYAPKTVIHNQSSFTRELA
jgi:peptidoglycan/xylan/chitin deacetylase (PgdA/CDA1 family)